MQKIIALFLLIFSAVFADVIQITHDNSEQVIGKSKLPLIVDVNASWCGPCKKMNPIIDELSTEYQGKVQFAKLDYDSHNALANQYDITGLPTLLFFKPGKTEPVMKSVGYYNKNDLKVKIDEFLKKK